jgi:hypothetical protein
VHGRVYQMFPRISDREVLLQLLVATASSAVVGYALYRVTDRQARRLGYIDIEANR